MKVNTTLLLILFLFCATSHAQKKQIVPNNYQLEAKEDYAKYEQNIIDGHNWLVENPVDSETEKRKMISAFIVQWITGSPNVTIELSADIITYMDSPECLIVFMSGWSKYALESRDFKNKIKGNLAGTESVIKFYKANKKVLGKNKEIEKLVRLKKSNKLEEFIKSKA